jgi:hypothetical protein
MIDYLTDLYALSEGYTAGDNFHMILFGIFVCFMLGGSLLLVIHEYFSYNISSLTDIKISVIYGAFIGVKLYFLIFSVVGVLYLAFPILLICLIILSVPLKILYSFALLILESFA